MEKDIKKKQLILSGILVSFSVLLALFFAGEIIIRLVSPLIQNYDFEMWRYAAYGKTLTRNPELGHMHKPNAYFKNLYGVEVKINSKTLRDYEYSYEKPKDTYRILLLGDSITFGWGVPFKETYAKRLEKNLNKNSPELKYQVINTGVGNYNTQDEVAFLEQEGLKYNPDMIILAFFINDAEINSGISYYSLKRHSYLYAFFWSRWNAMLTKLRPSRTFENYYKSLYNEGTITKSNVEKYFGKLINTTEIHDIPLLVIIIPDLHKLKNYPFSEIHNFVTQNFVEYDHVEVLDLLPHFDTDIDPTSYWVSSEDAHHNAKAHGIMAEAISSRIPVMVNNETANNK